MKKLTLSIGLVAIMLSSKAQDTIRYGITLTHKIEFNNDWSDFINFTLLNNGATMISVKNNEKLALWLRDEENATRKITIYYLNGDSLESIFNSKNNIFISPLGPFVLKVNKTKSIIK